MRREMSCWWCWMKLLFFHYRFATSLKALLLVFSSIAHWLWEWKLNLARNWRLNWSSCSNACSILENAITADSTKVINEGRKMKMKTFSFLEGCCKNKFSFHRKLHSSWSAQKSATDNSHCWMEEKFSSPLKTFLLQQQMRCSVSRL